MKEYWEDQYDWAEHNYDLYVPFLERAVRSGDREGWLGKEGRLGFILSDRFLNVGYGHKIREELPKSLRVDLLFDLRDTRVFEGALNYPAILIASRNANPRDGDLHATRVFTSEVAFEDLVEQFNQMRKQLKTTPIVRSDSLEAFPFPRTSLRGDGWWMMPEDERNLFRRLHALTGGRRLAELSDTVSGGFAGYQTSADPILVLDEVEDLGEVLRLRVRHEDDGCDKKPVEIEKGALRPFLFGKDVGRWAVSWKRTWVLFPYDLYAKKRTLTGDVVEDWNLIPSKNNLDRFEFAEPDDVETFEVRFPKAWKYLCKHEGGLRKREDDRFKESKPEGYVWYGATYPRGLNYYFRPKLVLQLLSRRNSFAFDKGGRFVFQAGGKGGGVYGFAPGERVKDLGALLSFLNSKVTDFLVKQTSSVYSGRFYSYADQFLRDLPVAEGVLKGSGLSRAAESLTGKTEERNAQRQKLEAFPTEFEGDLSRYELNSVGKLAGGQPHTAQLSIDIGSISVQKNLYAYEVQYGSQKPFEFEHREHAECLAEALRTRNRKTLHLEEILSWHLPVKPQGCKKLLELLHKTRQDLNRAEDQIVSLETDLNDSVYRLYEVTSAERGVIEDFLERYSSRPTGTLSGAAEEAPEE